MSVIRDKRFGYDVRVDDSEKVFKDDLFKSHKELCLDQLKEKIDKGSVYFGVDPGIEEMTKYTFKINSRLSGKEWFEKQRAMGMEQLNETRQKRQSVANLYKKLLELEQPKDK